MRPEGATVPVARAEQPAPGRVAWLFALVTWTILLHATAPLTSGVLEATALAGRYLVARG